MQKTIAKYIEENLLGAPGEIRISGDEDILTTGLIDSLGIVNLIGFLEEEFSLTIPPEDMTIENFLTIETIEGYLKTLKSQENENGFQ